MLKIKVIVTFLFLFSSVSIAQESLLTFRNGSLADADDINHNFQFLLNSLNSKQMSCNTYTRSGSSTVKCPDEQTMTGGGFASDNTSTALASRPFGNGWQCIFDDTSSFTQTCYVRCCGYLSEELGTGKYCNSNYCIQTDDYYDFVANISYDMTLEEGVFKSFPIEIDTSFMFPPENIGAMSWLIEFEGNTYDVNNIDESCLNAGNDWGNCLTTWENVDILEKAMLSGELKVSPGPLGILNEFQLNNSQGYNLRISARLDTGHTIDDASLISSGYNVYRVEPGTGNRDEGRCQEHSVDFLTSIKSGEFFETTNIRINSISSIIENPNTFPLTWWNGSAARILVCNDSPVGSYTVGFVARDGKGGKKFLGNITINVLSQFKSGGMVEPI